MKLLMLKKVTTDEENNFMKVPIEEEHLHLNKRILVTLTFRLEPGDNTPPWDGVTPFTCLFVLSERRIVINWRNSSCPAWVNEDMYSWSPLFVDSNKTLEEAGITGDKNTPGYLSDNWRNSKGCMGEVHGEQAVGGNHFASLVGAHDRGSPQVRGNGPKVGGNMDWLGDPGSASTPLQSTSYNSSESITSSPDTGTLKSTQQGGFGGIVEEEIISEIPEFIFMGLDSLVENNMNLEGLEGVNSGIDLELDEVQETINVAN
ncbi:hypothetical protein L1987_20392 [Smallanthus sonchifolius]|uniref:Uncharacterized protein n=1 Tax=Smallanthus sonchifolius TaxID=185202 RepID=A0ACB9ITS1_9ASTR|nr:hypothetical protein L1987_20392 [Smallanthus sonchifolius]